MLLSITLEITMECCEEL